MIIQIYEIQTEAEAEMVMALGVDHVGSVITSKTKWADPEIRSAVTLTRSAGKISSLIPLFSDEASICRCLDYYQPDLVHLCESITPEVFENKYIDMLILNQIKIRERFPEIKIMRSIAIPEPDRMNSDHVLTVARKFEPHSDFFLTDTILNPQTSKSIADHQPVAGFVGITGKICDWKIASDLVNQSKIPVILAGGLNPANVKDAILAVHPFGVDSCTGTNARDAAGKNIRFKKDSEKVRRFVDNARSACKK